VIQTAYDAPALLLPPLTELSAGHHSWSLANESWETAHDVPNFGHFGQSWASERATAIGGVGAVYQWIV
jgi:hypothetical protein